MHLFKSIQCTPPTVNPHVRYGLPVLSINSNIYTTLAIDNKNQGSYWCVGTIAYTASLYFLFNVSMKLKIL